MVVDFMGKNRLVKETKMKKRTKRLTGWITVFCIIGLLGGLVSIPRAATGDFAGILGGILALILLVSAQLMKQGSKVGWWILAGYFGIVTIGGLIFGGITMLGSEGRSQLWGKESPITILCFMILFYGFLGVLPFVLLVADPPWKWKVSDPGLSTEDISTRGPGTSLNQ